MALPATLRRFKIQLSDADRGVYETLELRAAQHPSESDRYLVTRVLARCLEHADGVDFTRGLAAAEEPALWERDLRGDVRSWIEVGSPSIDRLHRAGKAAQRVCVYAWKGVPQLAREIVSQKVHRGSEIELHALDPAFLDLVCASLDRANVWSLSVSGGTLYLEISGALHETRAERVPIG